MRQAYVVGVDIGTSGTKAIIVRNDGVVIATHTQEYPLYTPQAGWSEQDPADWWSATINCLTAVVKQAHVPKESIAGLGLSGQMHGLVALDAGHRVLRRAILWNDQRTTAQCEQVLAGTGGLSGLLQLTNNTMLPGYTGGKLLWMRENEPTLFEQMQLFLNPKDYIRYLLTGEIATEVSDASGTGLFDVKSRRWSWPLIEKLQLARSIFPTCLESSDIAGHITSEIAQQTGLREGLPVVAGGGDAVIQTTGTGLTKQGVLGIVVGTSGVVAMGLEGYQDNTHGKLQVFCNNAPHLWHAMGVTLCAGGSYRWYRDTLCTHELKEAQRQGKDVYDVMGEAAHGSRIGSGGLLFLPYLSGERCPMSDANARGTFIGLSLGTSKGDMTRAVMEGVTCSLKQVADLIVGMGQSITSEKIILSGGGASSPLWRQMHADLFGLPVVTVSGASEGGAYGAALVAGVGCGVFADLVEATSVLKEETITRPNPQNTAAYEDLYQTYISLYPMLKPAFDGIAKLS